MVAVHHEKHCAQMRQREDWRSPALGVVLHRSASILFFASAMDTSETPWECTIKDIIIVASNEKHSIPVTAIGVSLIMASFLLLTVLLSTLFPTTIIYMPSNLAFSSGNSFPTLDFFMFSLIVSLIGLKGSAKVTRLTILGARVTGFGGVVIHTSSFLIGVLGTRFILGLIGIPDLLDARGV